MTKAARAAVPDPPARPVVELLPLDQVVESPLNPRKTFAAEDLEELAEDVRRRGVLQPVLVRPAGERYELVFGARRYRAALAAGLKAIPAMVRELTDAEALEIAIVENAKRSDVHPLEEADGYRALHEQHGLTVDDIAGKVGKSKGWVYARMKLGDLAGAAREVFWSGELPASHALLIARLPAHQQEQALQRIRMPEWQGTGFIPHTRAEEILREEFTRGLITAPFNPKDTTLVPEAGSCLSCPKRAGNVDGAKGRGDVCTDTACFGAKAKAWAERKAAEAEKTGLKVLRGKEASEALHFGSEWARLDEPVYLDEDDGEETTFGAIAKQEGLELKPAAFAVDDLGRAHELYPRKEILQPLAEKGNTWAKGELDFIQRQSRSNSGSDNYRQQQLKREKDLKRRREVARITIAHCVQEVEAGNRRLDDLKTWALVAELALRHGTSDALRAFAKRRGLKNQGGYDAEPEIRKLITTAIRAEDLAGVTLELLVSDLPAGSTWGGDSYSKSFRAMAEAFGVDLKQAERDLKRLEREKEKAKAKKPAKKGGAR